LRPATRIFGDWLHSTDGVLCLFPEWFARPQPDWPEPHRLSGFPLFNETHPDEPDPELDAFLETGERPVVFTAGSTLTDHAHYAQTVDSVLRDTGLRGILLTPDAPRQSNTPTLLARRYVPMRTLLPRCRALVHHGGIGTAALAFAAGIPQIVTPFAHDQFDNAQRVVASGCGVRLDAPLRPQALARALKHVLGSPSIRTQCDRMRDRLASAPDGCETAARFIEASMRGGARECANTKLRSFALAARGQGT
jgi:rhamnosyltransferase subunit B